MTGTIKTLKKEKGFGFIRDDKGESYFFHVSACESKDAFMAMLERKTKVSFELSNGPKGPRAEQVVVL